MCYLTAMSFPSHLSHQERHGSVCVRYCERRFGGHRRSTDAGRPDPVGQRRGRQVGHSGGRGSTTQGRSTVNETFALNRVGQLNSKVFGILLFLFFWL